MIQRIKQAIIGARGRSSGAKPSKVSPLHTSVWEGANIKRAIIPLSLLLILMLAATAFAQDNIARDDLRERILTLAETRPIAQVIALVLIGVCLYAGGLLFHALRQRHQIAWWPTARLAGWIVPLLTTAVMVAMILNRDQVKVTPMVSMSVLQLVLPLGAALHTALIFAPEEEPLEMLLALKRPITWLVFERVLVIAMIYIGIGLIGMGLLATQDRLGDVVMRLAAILPSMLFLMTFTIYLTTRVRTMMMGLVGAIAVWFISLLFGQFLMPGAAGAKTPFPMNYVQPFLWTVNIFAQPLSFPAWEYYTLNRIILLGLSVFWLWRTAAQLGDSETLLLTLQDRQTRRRSAPAIEIPKTKRSLKLNPAPVAINVLWQIVAMWLYETKLHWRRRPLKVLLFTLLITTGVILLISYESLIRVMLPGLELAQIEVEQQMWVKGLAFMRMSMAVLTVVQMLVLPVMLADSIPLDESDHMGDMLRSTALPGWAYLAGKIGGMWWASMSAIALAFAILSGLWLLAVGPYNPIPMLDSWIVLSAPVVLFNGGFALLIGGTQPTRRRAMIAVIIVFFASISIGARATEGILASLNLNPFSASLLLTIFSQNNTPPITYAPILSLPGMGDYMLGRGVVFLITALIVGAWWTLRWSGILLRPKTTPTPAPLPVQQGS